MNAAYIKAPHKRQVTWRKGPPPLIGWWPASLCGNPLALRYWDGSIWSFAALHTANATTGAQMAKVKTTPQCTANIEWCDRWWE